MHDEVRRAFPVIVFQSRGMPIMDARIHALTELLGVGALKNRNVVTQGPEKGVAVIYEWTELGLRMLLNLHAASAERIRELRTQMASVAAGAIPPPTLLDMPVSTPEPASQVDMVKVAEVDRANEAANSGSVTPSA